MKKILLADDHAIVRSALTYLIRDVLPDTDIHEATDGQGVLYSIHKTSYDLIVLDMQMPGIYIDVLIEDIRRMYPTVPILIFTVNNHLYFAKRYRQQGVAGFLSKDAAEEEVVQAITTILSGKKYFPDAIVSSPGSSNPFELLSSREFRVMVLMATGKPQHEIAGMLKVTPSTIAAHQKQIFRKLQVGSQFELAKLAERYRLWT